jgi:hypothetical protein
MDTHDDKLIATVPGTGKANAGAFDTHDRAICRIRRDAQLLRAAQGWNLHAKALGCVIRASRQIHQDINAGAAQYRIWRYFNPQQ